VLLHYLVKC